MTKNLPIPRNLAPSVRCFGHSRPQNSASKNSFSLNKAKENDLPKATTSATKENDLSKTTTATKAETLQHTENSPHFQTTIEHIIDTTPDNTRLGQDFTKAELISVLRSERKHNKALMLDNSSLRAALTPPRTPGHDLFSSLGLMTAFFFFGLIVLPTLANLWSTFFDTPPTADTPPPTTPDTPQEGTLDLQSLAPAAASTMPAPDNAPAGAPAPAWPFG